MVRNFPGIRPDIVFWDDEYNSIPRGRARTNPCKQSISRGHCSTIGRLACGPSSGVHLRHGWRQYDEFGYCTAWLTGPSISRRGPFFWQCRIQTHCSLTPSCIRRFRFLARRLRPCRKSPLRYTGSARAQVIIVLTGWRATATRAIGVRNHRSLVLRKRRDRAPILWQRLAKFRASCGSQNHRHS